MPRTPLSDTAKSNRPLRIRLTDAEREELNSTATIEQKPTSTWARDILLAAAQNARKRKKSSR